MRPESLVGLLAEPDRVRAFAAVVLGAETVADVRSMTGLDQRAAATAVTKLVNGGLVAQSPAGLAADVEVFKEAAKAAAPPPQDHGYADDRVESIVRAFVRDGVLVGVPAQAGRRRTLLEHVAQSFEPGRGYDEKEVNAVLRAWTAGGGVDHVTVRRHLVDEGLLARDDGVYRRSGGWVDVLDA